jgi:hypothetical protein
MSHWEKDSPQTISSMRILATCLWKQKKFKEGGEWVDECMSRVENMEKGKFAKYQDAEMRKVDQMMAALRKWRGVWRVISLAILLLTFNHIG